MCALLILGEIHNATLVNATNAALQMPLHLAARNGMATVVQALLSRGATVLAVDEEGKERHFHLFQPCLHFNIMLWAFLLISDCYLLRPFSPPRA